MMKHILLIFCTIAVFSCTSRNKKKSTDDVSKQTENISEGQSESLAFKPDTMRGERIDGPANIRDKIKGRIMFQLKDWTLVETSPLKDDWYVVGVPVRVTKEQLKEFKILPNTKLFSKEGNEVGETKDTVYLTLDMGDCWLIMGQTYKDNIKSNSIPEKVLEKILETETPLTKNTLSSFMKDFEFRKYDLGLIPNTEQYFIYQSSIVDPSARDRITLLFRESNLIGVVHSRKLDIKKYETYELIRGHKLIITANLEENEIEEIKSKRIKFYNSVD